MKLFAIFSIVFIALFSAGSAIGQDNAKAKDPLCDDCAKRITGFLDASEMEVPLDVPACALCKKNDVDMITVNISCVLCNACAEKGNVCMLCLIPMAEGWPESLDDVKGLPTEKLLFVSNRDGENEFFTMNLDGKEQTQLTKDDFVEMDPAVSPDGKWIVFSGNMDGWWDLFVMDIRGEHLRRLTKSAGAELSPCWYPDNKTIVFMFQDNMGMKLCTIMRDGSDMKPVEMPDEFDNMEVGYPVVSPDGKKIAFVAGQRDDEMSWDIYVRDEKGVVVNITNDEFYNSAPAWSPDGKKIAYSFSDDVGKGMGNDEIYVMDSDGKNHKRLTENKFVDSGPNWSPDGKNIVFISTRDQVKEGIADVYIMDSGGKNQINITNSSSKDLAPRWVKADGKK
ncbi:MAG: PD40 domain-containing protein [Planctomycetes bacterium]|nr:PD40 domain-containing protein [Planctomycetota bacterium]